MSRTRELSTLIALALPCAALASGHAHLTLMASDPSSMHSPDSIYQNLSALYDAPTGALRVTAELQLGALSLHTVKLDGKSSISITGGKLKEKTAFRGATYYEASIKEPSQTRHTLTLAYDFGNSVSTYANEIAVKEASMAGVPSSISKSSGATIAVKASSVEKDEKFALEIRSSAGGSAYKTLRGDELAGGIRLEPSDLAGLAPGSARMLLSRSSGTSLKQAGKKGGMLTALYRTAEEPIEITP